MLAAVHPDDAPDVGAAFIDEENPIGQLVNLGGIRCVHHAGHTGGQAETFGIVLGVVFGALVEDLFGLGSERNFHRPAFRRFPLLLHVDDVRHLPHALAAEIGLAGIHAQQRIFGKARRGTGGRPVGPAPAAAESLTAAGRSGRWGRFLRSRGRNQQGSHGQNRNLRDSLQSRRLLSPRGTRRNTFGGKNYCIDPVALAQRGGLQEWAERAGLSRRAIGLNYRERPALPTVVPLSCAGWRNSPRISRSASSQSSKAVSSPDPPLDNQISWARLRIRSFRSRWLCAISRSLSGMASSECSLPRRARIRGSEAHTCHLKPQPRTLNSRTHANRRLEASCAGPGFVRLRVWLRGGRGGQLSAVSA